MLFNCVRVTYIYTEEKWEKYMHIFHRSFARFCNFSHKCEEIWTDSATFTPVQVRLGKIYMYISLNILYIYIYTRLRLCACVTIYNNKMCDTCHICVPSLVNSFYSSYNTLRSRRVSSFYSGRTLHSCWSPVHYKCNCVSQLNRIEHIRKWSCLALLLPTTAQIVIFYEI